MALRQSRRTFLKTIAIASSSGVLAGCSQLGLGEQGIELGHVLVQNGHPNPHTVRVELDRDGERVLEETVEVSAIQDRIAQVEVIEATWSIDPAVYDLSYVVIGPDEALDIRTKRVTADDKNSQDDTCNLVKIRIGSPTDLPPHVIISEPAGREPTCSD